MKIKISVLTLFFIEILLLSGCNSRTEKHLVIPENYIVNQSLYLAEGAGIYGLIENNSINYDEIRDEICNGNADDIREQYENLKVSEENLETYVAVQNLLGITEIYLGDYEQAYRYFNEAIDLINDSPVPEKKRILTVLYNNAGTVTASMPGFDMEDERLEKASELCEDPYMELVVAVNQSARTKKGASLKELGIMIEESVKLIKRETQLVKGIGFVGFQAAGHMAAAYLSTGQTDREMKIVEKYIPLVPDTAEYNLQRALLLEYKGYGFYAMEDYEKAKEYFWKAVMETEKTVDERSRRLSAQNFRYGVACWECGEWDKGVYYMKKAIRGSGQATPDVRGAIFYNIGYAYWKLEKLEEARDYLLRSYLFYREVSERATELAREYLWRIYKSENDTSCIFEEWLEKELEKVDMETEPDIRKSDS